jgi:hypothetical protein
MIPVRGFLRARFPSVGAAVLRSQVHNARPAASVFSPWRQQIHGMSMAEISNKTGIPVRTITMVKKLTPDGTACRKCLDIEARLEQDGLIESIDEMMYMDPENPDGDPGTMLATKHGIKVAPFFVVRTTTGEVMEEDVYSVYMKMKREVFGKKATMSEANTDVAMQIF